MIKSREKYAEELDSKDERDQQSLNKISKTKSKQIGFSRIINRFIILVGLGFPVIIATILACNYQVQKKTSEKYELVLGSGNVIGEDLELRVLEGYDNIDMNKSRTFQGIQVGEITTTPITFEWSPKNFPFTDNITMSGIFSDDGDWDIATICGDCENNKYVWHPFYRGELKDYSLIDQVGDIYFYSNSINETVQKSSSVDIWAQRNISIGSKIKILDDSVKLSLFENKVQDFVQNQDTILNIPLRGPHKFYLYLEDNFHLSVIKEDLDWQEDLDEVTVRLRDLSGNTVLEKKIEDNDIDNDFVENFDLDFLPHNGVYTLEFLGNNDWKISDIKVNTNKIVLDGNIHSLEPVEFFTKINIDDQHLRFYIWHDTAYQKVSIIKDNSTETIDMNKGQLYREVLYGVNAGEYTINIPLGDVVVGGSFLAINKDNYFEPFINGYKIGQTVSKEIKYDYVISNVKMEQAEDGLFRSTIVIPKKEFLRLTDLKSIKLQIKNTGLNSRNDRRKGIIENGYDYVANYKQYEIWKKDTQETPEISDDYSDITDLIQQELPEYTSVYVKDQYPVEQDNFIQKDKIENYDNNINSSEIGLRGEHDFFVYLKDRLYVKTTIEDLNWYEGKDNITIILQNADGETVCGPYLTGDDGNNTADRKSTVSQNEYICENLSEGVYILSFKERFEEAQSQAYNDFKIVSIDINSNKFVIKDRAVPIDSKVLYVNNPYITDLGVNYWWPDRMQIVSIRGNTSLDINLDEAVFGDVVEQQLSIGENDIFTPKGMVNFTGSNFAVDKVDWFNVYTHKITSEVSYSEDYLIIYDKLSSPSYLVKFEISTGEENFAD